MENIITLTNLIDNAPQAVMFAMLIIVSGYTHLTVKNRNEKCEQEVRQLRADKDALKEEIGELKSKVNRLESVLLQVKGHG